VAEQQPSEDELRRQLEDELKRLKISDLLVQTIYTVSSLGYRKLSEEDRDLDEVRLAIDALSALVPVLEGTMRPDLIRDLNQMKANMQLAYASVVAETSASKEDSGPEG
jgi:hypothetical protein